MNTQERTLPTAIVALVVIAMAIAAIALASDLGALSPTREAAGTGLNSPPECESPNVLENPDDGTVTPFVVTLRAGQDSIPAGLTLPAGPITAICIKSGTNMFGGSGHSPLITTNGNYGGPPQGHPGCYTVSGLGTTAVTITRNFNGPVTGPANDPNTLWCQQISHIDVPVQPTPTPTPTSTPTPTPTPVAVLGVVQGPTALPDTGGAPEADTLSSLAILLGLGGLAILSGTGTLVAVAARRRR